MNLSVDENYRLVRIRVIEILAVHVSGIDWDLTCSSRLVDDLYVDSVCLIEIVMTLNQTFGIEFPDSAVAEWRTVTDVCASVVGAQKSASLERR